MKFQKLSYLSFNFLVSNDQALGEKDLTSVFDGA